MQIGTAAEQSRVSPKTIRYYESVGLIAPARRTASGYREYGERDVQTLRFIQRSRSLGFSVSDVSRLLNLWQDRDRQSARVKALANRHVTEIDRKMAELRGMRETLVHLIARCHGDDRPDCPILEDLASAPAPGTNGSNR